MLAEPQPTPYDLKFRAFGFPVRVHPLFWLATAMLGWSGDRPNAGAFLLMWVGVVFVSILVHELGHAFAFRAFGGDGRVWLYWFGGLAIPESGPGPRSPVKQIAISLAGPGAGFLLAGVVYATNETMDWRSGSIFAWEFYSQMMWVNVVWGLVNLLPVYPLDGGQVCREVCVLLRVRRAQAVSLQISMVTAGAIAVLSLMNTVNQPADLLAQLPWWLRIGSLFTTVMFGVLAYSSYQMWTHVRQRDSYWDDPDDDTPPWNRR